MLSAAGSAGGSGKNSQDLSRRILVQLISFQLRLCSLISLKRSREGCTSLYGDEGPCGGVHLMSHAGACGGNGLMSDPLKGLKGFYRGYIHSI